MKRRARLILGTALLAVLATGEPQQLSDEAITAQARPGDPAQHAAAGASPADATADVTIRVSRLYDGVAIAWRGSHDTDRLAALLQHGCQLPARAGGFHPRIAEVE